MCCTFRFKSHTEEHVLKELIFYDKILKKTILLLLAIQLLIIYPLKSIAQESGVTKKKSKTALDKFLKINNKYKLIKSLSNNLLLSNNILGHIIKFKN